MEIIGQGDVCDFCKKNKKSFDKAYAPFKYEGEVRKVTLNFKSKNAKYLAEPMANLMLKDMPENMKDFDYIIPVPCSESTLKTRGYNQSELLANEISKKTNKEILTNILIKHKDTKAQKELSFNERKKNLKDAFKIKNKKIIKDKIILLVDDVMTTCATANLCSDLLKHHCKKVYVLIFARNTINSIKK
jgi:competence protein ComFC